MKRVLGAYANGNYNVILLDDGTKIRCSGANSCAKPDMFESVDIKITDRCSHKCPWCHEGCTCEGEHAYDMLRKYKPLFDSMHPFTELAIGGGNVMECKELLRGLLELCEHNSLVPSITVNYSDFIENHSDINELICDKLLYGVGVSMPTDPEKWDSSLLSMINETPHAVCHCIFGVTPPEAIKKGYNLDLDILFLGYKWFRRGKTYGSDNIEKIGEVKTETEKLIPEIIRYGLYNHVCFDTLGATQTNLRYHYENAEDWGRLFMGNDGEYTMYIDFVNEQFAKSSGSFIRYKLNPFQTAREIFAIVHREKIGQQIGTIDAVHCDDDGKYYNEPGEYGKAEEEGN